MKHLVIIAAAGGLVAQPIQASVRDAAFASSGDQARAQRFLFTGARVRVGVGHRKSRPEASLSLAGGTSQAGFAPRIDEGVALSLTSSRSTPALTIAGQDARDLGQRMGIGKGGKIALIVGGLAIAAVVAVAVAADEVVDRLNEDDDE